jgi:hypothetical protein
VLFDADHHVIEGEVRFKQVVANTKVAGAKNGVAVLGGGEKDHGNRFILRMLSHGGQEGDAIHAGHADVEQAEDGFFFFLFQGREGVEAVGSADGFIAFEAQCGGDGLAADGRVIDDEDRFHALILRMM